MLTNMYVTVKGCLKGCVRMPDEVVLLIHPREGSVLGQPLSGMYTKLPTFFFVQIY